jgi:hypothetical protein
MATEINLYHLFGTLRYGKVVGDIIFFDHAFIRGGHFLPVTIKNTLFPIFKVLGGVYPTKEEWDKLCKDFAGR